MNDLIFTTDRLAIRDFRETDLNDVVRMWSDPAAARFMDDAPKTSSQSAEWLERVIHHNRVVPREAYNLAITLRVEDRAFGWVGFGPSERDRQGGAYGVGYLLESSHWRRGYMSEVLPGVVDFVVNQLAGTKLVAWCYAENTASSRTLEKAGFTLTGAGSNPEAMNDGAEGLNFEYSPGLAQRE
jgi:putative acetyltransferase